MKWLAAYLRDCAEGLRIICSRPFWRVVRDYWSPMQVAARIDAFTARMRPPDPPV